MKYLKIVIEHISLHCFLYPFNLVVKRLNNDNAELLTYCNILAEFVKNEYR